MSSSYSVKLVWRKLPVYAETLSYEFEINPVALRVISGVLYLRDCLHLSASLFQTQHTRQNKTDEQDHSSPPYFLH